MIIYDITEYYSADRDVTEEQRYELCLTSEEENEMEEELKRMKDGYIDGIIDVEYSKTIIKKIESLFKYFTVSEIKCKIPVLSPIFEEMYIKVHARLQNNKIECPFCGNTIQVSPS